MISLDITKSRHFWGALIVELIGIIFMALGLGYEIAIHGNLGYIMFSMGCALSTAGAIWFAKAKPFIMV